MDAGANERARSSGNEMRGKPTHPAEGPAGRYGPGRYRLPLIPHQRRSGVKPPLATTPELGAVDETAPNAPRAIQVRASLLLACVRFDQVCRSGPTSLLKARCMPEKKTVGKRL